MFGDNCCDCNVDDMCPPTPTCASYSGYTFMNMGATVALPSSLTQQTMGFGTTPWGYYVGVYCTGAFIFNESSACLGAPGGSQSWTVACIEDNPWTSTPLIPIFNWIYSAGQASVTGVGCLASQVLAEAAQANDAQFLNAHDGSSNITLKFADGLYTDNIDGSPNPTFALFQKIPPTTAKFSMKCASAHWTSVNVAANVAITFRNRNCYGWPLSSLVLTLSGAGAGSVTGGPFQSDYSTPFNLILTEGPVDITVYYTITASSPNVAATLTFDSTIFSAPFTPNPTISANLLTSSNITLIDTCVTWVSVGSTAKVLITINNGGCLDFDLTGVSLTGSGSSFGSVAGPFETDCATALTGSDLSVSPGSNSQFCFTFDATNADVNASLNFPNAFATPSISIMLAAILNVHVAQGSVICSGSGIGGLGGYLINLTITNHGNWTVKPTSIGIDLDNTLTSYFPSGPCPTPTLANWPQTFTLSPSTTLTCNNATLTSSVTGAPILVRAHGTINPSITAITQGSCNYASLATTNSIAV